MGILGYQIFKEGGDTYSRLYLPEDEFIAYQHVEAWNKNPLTTANDKYRYSVRNINISKLHGQSIGIDGRNYSVERTVSGIRKDKVTGQTIGFVWLDGQRVRVRRTRWYQLWVVVGGAE